MLAYEFVEFIPDQLKGRTLYISHTYCTAVHKCCCGCGREVVTPLSSTGWQVTFDGKTVSLYPSIGSWSLPCQSHYFITKNKVVWATECAGHPAVEPHEPAKLLRRMTRSILAVLPIRRLL